MRSRAAPGGIDEADAWDIINFLRPDGRFPEYYNPGSAKDWHRIQVHGSVTLCELTIPHLHEPVRLLRR